MQFVYFQQILRIYIFEKGLLFIRKKIIQFYFLTSMEINNADLLEDLRAKQLIQFGRFVLKSGQISSIYVDLRELISYEEIMQKASDAQCEAIKNSGIEFDYIVGVPYGALILAYEVAKKLGKGIIMKRKEVKSHGKKEMFLGNFVPGRRAVIIEDVVTTGSSVKETLDELNKVGLICGHAFCIVDREQGGVESLQREGLKLHSLIQMNSILDFLVSSGEIDLNKRSDIAGQLKNPSYENSDAIDDWKIQKRFVAFERGTLNRKLADIMLAKKTNLCLAVDGFPKERILEIAESVGASICALKLHCDTIDDWDQQFAGQLRRMADDKHFLLFEDRKLADTANTMEMQLTRGYRISEWADLVTIYPEPGRKSIEALKSIVNSPNHRLSAFLMLAELSTEGAKTNVQNGVEVAEAIGTEMIGGFICQKRCSKNPKFLYWTPGVNLRASTDGKGQGWRGPEQAILADGCDLVIVGRGITEAEDMAAEARKYANAAWEALTKE